MPPQYVKAYVKRNKHDPADAEACCEAVRRPSMRFVPVKTEEQQAVLIMHRTRELLVRQRTQVVNALRGHLAEFGIIEPQGIWHVGRLRARIEDESTIPEPGWGGDPGLASRQSGQSALGQDPRHRSPDRQRYRRHRAGSLGIPLGPGVCCLARPRSPPALDRRQGASGPN